MENVTEDRKMCGPDLLDSNILTLGGGEMELKLGLKAMKSHTELDMV